jgi:hypothetical protein
MIWKRARKRFEIVTRASCPCWRLKHGLEARGTIDALDDQRASSPAPQPLDYARPFAQPSGWSYAIAVSTIALVAAATAAWCAVHTFHVIVEVQRVGHRAIDFDPSYLGLPIEKAIPLGIFGGGLALVALIHFIRFVNSARRWRGR